MYRYSRRTGALVAIILFVAPNALGAVSRIGVATSVRPNVQGGMGTNFRSLLPGTDLYANETVRTGNLGQADLVFIDNTSLTVGPTTEILLDEFIYDPTVPSGRFVIQATHGAFRVVTGTSVAYQIKTPDGTLDTRRAVVEFVVQSKEQKSRKRKPTHWGECDTIVRLVEGQATYRTISGRTSELTEQGSVVCISPVGIMSYAASSDSILIEDPPPPMPPPDNPPPSCVSPTTLNCR